MVHSVSLCLYHKDIPVELRKIIVSYLQIPIYDSEIKSKVNTWNNRNKRDLSKFQKIMMEKWSY
jgi:hypothetical protein